MNGQATGLTNPYYRIESPRGLCVTKTGAELHVSQLSAGERAFMALAGDLARRLAILNPDLQNPLSGSAIVLIDELELHLHPRWQHKIVAWLLSTFPNCQFVVSTHSPQVLSEVQWTPTYKNFAGAPKAGTHTALLEEQGFVCAYCGRELKADRTDSHIDHFWPQTGFNAASPPDKTLDYENFFASCGPQSLPFTNPRLPQTCGEAKGDWSDLIHYIIPSRVGCEIRFAFGSRGDINPSDPLDTAATNMISALNLNDPALAYERMSLITGLEEDIESGEINSESKLEEIAYWRTRILGHLPNFGHVAARYLEEEPV